MNVLKPKFTFRRLLFWGGLFFLAGTLSLSAEGLPSVFSKGLFQFQIHRDPRRPIAILKLGQEKRQPLPHFSFNRSLRDVLREVQSEEEGIFVDCNLFIQIAALMLTDGLDKDSFQLIHPRYLSLEIMATLYPHLKFAYLQPTDPLAAHTLRKLNYLNKGQWLIELTQDRFLGLTSDGPQLKNLSWWIEQMKREVKHELWMNAQFERTMFECKAMLAVLRTHQTPSADILEDSIGERRIPTRQEGLESFRLDDWRVLRPKILLK